MLSYDYRLTCSCINCCIFKFYAMSMNFPFILRGKKTIQKDTIQFRTHPNVLKMKT